MENPHKKVIKDIDTTKVVEKVNEVIAYAEGVHKESVEQKQYFENKIAELEQKVIAQAALNTPPPAPDVPIVGKQEEKPASDTQNQSDVPVAEAPAEAPKQEEKPATEAAPAVEEKKE